MNKLVGSSLAVVFSAVVGLVACNSGGGGNDSGGGGGGGALSGGAAAQSAILAVGFASSYGSSLGSDSGSLRAGRAKGTAGLAARLNSNFRSARARATAAAVVPAAPVDCDVSGTWTETTSAGGTTTTTYDNCIDIVTWYDDNGNPVDARELQNGTVTFTSSTSGFTMTSGSSGAPYTDRYYRTSDNAVLEEDVDVMSVEVTASATTTCVYGDWPSDATATLSGTTSWKYDGDANGTLDENAESTFTSVSIHIVSVLNTSTCDETSNTTTMSGTIAYTDNVTPADSATITIASGSPLIIATTYGATSESMTISGTLTVDPACADAATITLATTTPIVTDYLDDCPSSGTLTISGDASATVVFNSDGSMDAGGTHYATCDDAAICS